MSYVQASQDLKVHPTQLGNWVIRGALPWSRSDEARAARDRAAQARGHEAEGRARHPKKSRGLHSPITYSHSHVHNETHEHDHTPNDPPNEPHTHTHRHSRQKHSHPHLPDMHRQHLSRAISSCSGFI